MAQVLRSMLASGASTGLWRAQPDAHSGWLGSELPPRHPAYIRTAGAEMEQGPNVWVLLLILQITPRAPVR